MAKRLYAKVPQFFSQAIFIVFLIIDAETC